MAPKSTGADETPETKSKTPPADQDYQAALATKEAEIGQLEKRIQGLVDHGAALESKNILLEKEAELLKEKLEQAYEVVESKNSVIQELEETIENSKTVIPGFENGFLDKVVLNTSIHKDEVHAVKGDLERSFPRLAWDSLPKDKGGWQIKVETPKEAQ